MSSHRAAEGAEDNWLSGEVVDAALRIHRGLGPGLLESVYQRVLARDLVARGHRVQVERQVSFEFEGLRFVNAYRVDILVEDTLVIEVKSVQALPPVFKKQLLTYLRLLDAPLGLLLNFGAPLMKDGIHRIINTQSR